MKTEQLTEAPAAKDAGFEAAIQIPSGKVQLKGDWVMPENVLGIVLFAHGSGSSRHSIRNKAVARVLQRHGIGTLLMDLLTPEEEGLDAVTAHLRFDIPLLARRLGDATEWLRNHSDAHHHPIGYFGASTGGAGALVAAAERPGEISAVVSRGGRPDLAGRALPYVTAPTLLIVGGDDEIVVDLNREALAKLECVKDLVIVPGATHLFEEAGAMERVASLAADWFAKHLSQANTTAPVTPAKGKGR